MDNGWAVLHESFYECISRSFHKLIALRAVDRAMNVSNALDFYLLWDQAVLENDIVTIPRISGTEIAAKWKAGLM
jgi:hypothetical protein